VLVSTEPPVRSVSVLLEPELPGVWEMKWWQVQCRVPELHQEFPASRA
jgi:hypothetical protein